MNYRPIRYEAPDDCASTIGTAPHRTRIGAAELERSESGIVIWNESPDGWGQPAFIESRYIHMAVQEAVSAMGIDFSKAKPEWFITAPEMVTR